MKEGKAMKTLDDFIYFTFGYPSLFITHTHTHTHTHTKLSQLMSACSIHCIAIRSTYQTVCSFGSLPLKEQGVHSCNLLLLLLHLLDANNMNELQVKFVSPANILNAIFHTLINPVYYGTSSYNRTN